MESTDTLEIKDESLIQDEKTFNRNKWFFACGAVGRDMVYSLVASYFFTYVQFGLTLSIAQFATLNILIGVLGRVWDGVNDPMMGTIIDGAHFKWGKFKPWIFWGAILTGVLMLVLFNVRPFGIQAVYGWIYVGIICVVYLLWEAAFTMNDIGYWGAIPSLSRGGKRRDKLTSLVIFFSGVGGGIMTLIVSYLSPGNVLNAYTMFSIIACVGIVGCQTMVAFTVKEAPRSESESEDTVSLKKTFKVIFQNKQVLWISLGYLLYDIGNGLLGALIYNLYYLEVGYDGSMAIVILGVGVLAMLLQVLYPKITKNWTRKKIQKFGMITLSIGYLWIAIIGWTKFLPFNSITLAVGYIFIMVGQTYFYISSLINLTNCVEYNEYTTGERNEAVISSVRPLLVKFGSAVKSLFTMLILFASGLYVLSQNISNLETQSSLFNKKVAGDVQDVDTMKKYTDKINYYSDLISQGKSTDFIDDEIGSLSSDDVIVEMQTSGEYIDVYENMYILRYANYTENGSTKKVLEAAKQIKAIEADENYFIKSGMVNVGTNVYNVEYTYEASFKFNDVDIYGNSFDVNEGTAVYVAKRSPKNQIILRVCVTVLPILIIFGSFYIQRHQFIIDEKYYDMMVTEIAKRKEVAKDDPSPTE